MTDPTTDPTGDADPPNETEEPKMLLARMAEAVYWTGRYLERAECTARIVQVHTDAHVDMPIGEDVGWEPLLAIAGVGTEFGAHYPAAAGAGDAAAEDDVIEFLLHSESNPSSILAAISAARENLRTGSRPQAVAQLLGLPRRDPDPQGTGPVAAEGDRRLPEDQRHHARYDEPR